MKKFAALLMSMTLLSSLALFVACGDSDKQENQGKLDGDFSTEATDEEVTAVLTKLQNAVDGNTFLGDTAAEDWSFGFDAGADVSFSMVGLEPGSGENAQVGANVHFDLGVGYKLIIGNSAVSGAGDLSVKGSGSVMGSNANYSAKIYNDADYLYMDMSSVPGYPKVKLTYETVMGAIESVGSGESQTPADTPSTMSADAAPGTGSENEGGQGTETAPSSDIAKIVAGLKEVGCKVYIDDSEGLKVKLSISEETVDMILEALELVPADGADALVDFSAFSFDLYFAMTEDGVFSYLSADFDVKMSLDLGEHLGKYGIECSGYIYAKSYEGTVKLPDDLAEYTEVNEIPSFPTPSGQ